MNDPECPACGAPSPLVDWVEVDGRAWEREWCCPVHGSFAVRDDSSAPLHVRGRLILGYVFQEHGDFDYPVPQRLRSE